MNKSLNEILFSQKSLFSIQSLMKNTDKSPSLDFLQIKKLNDLKANIEYEKLKNELIEKEYYLNYSSIFRENWTFEKMVANQDNYIQINNAKNFVHKICNSTELDDSPNLIIIGNRGSGKSHMAGAIAHLLTQKNKKISFINFYDLMNSEEKFKKSDFISNKNEIVFLDDVITSSQNFNQSHKELLALIIRRRYISNLSTILVFNSPSIHSIRLQVGEYCFGGILDLNPDLIDLTNLCYRKLKYHQN